MKLSNLPLLISFTLCGCSTFDNEDNQDYLLDPKLVNTVSPLEASRRFEKHYKHRLDIPKINTDITGEAETPYNADSHKSRNINHYVRGIMQDMAGNLQNVNATSPVAVASFVFLDEPYDKASLLGNQIAESFIHEIRKFDITVLDFKTMDYILVTPEGDFAQSRNFEELSNVSQIIYIITGTLVKHRDGYLVNARMISMKSKVVVASAQRLIPNNVADALMSSKIVEKNKNIKNEQVLEPKVTLIQG
jgi:TolB-like protein